MKQFLPGLLLGIILGALLATLITSHGLSGGRDAAPTGDEEAVYQGQPLSHWLAQLKDRDAIYRVRAVTALGEMGLQDDIIYEAILKSLGDENSAVRVMAWALPSSAARMALRRSGRSG